jgi:hypothetical protein
METSLTLAESDVRLDKGILVRGLEKRDSELLSSSIVVGSKETFVAGWLSLYGDDSDWIDLAIIAC